MNTDSDYVFHSHDSRVFEAYAIWKKKAESAILL